MLWIGITGSIGTGKSTFANILRKHGHIVLDADELAKASLEPGTNAFKKLVSALGASIVDSSGRIDRSELGRQVFSDKKKLSILESIVHPEVKLIVEQSKSEHESKNQKVLFYDVPLLFEKQMEKTFDLVVMVTASVDNQIKRIKLRNTWSDEEIRMRISAQLAPSEKESKAHVLIHNDGDITDLENEVLKFTEWLKTIS